MAVELSESNGAVELRNERVRVRAELAELRLEASGLDGAIALRGFRPRVEVAGRALRAGRAATEGGGELATALGPATQVTLVGDTETSISLELRIALGAGWPGFTLDLTARAPDGTPARVEALEPLHLSVREGGAIELPGPPRDLRFLRLGYQSWSPAGLVALRGREPRPRRALGRTVFCGPFTPLPGRGRRVSDFATTLRAPGAPGLTLGFLTHRRFLTHVALQHRRGAIASLAARVSTEGASLGPGTGLAGERLWVGFESAAEDGLAAWAERAGREMGAPLPARAGTGWCSWYQYFTRVTADDVRSNLRALAELGAAVDTVQIDDGYQAAVGDWLEAAAGFPGGIAPLAAEIHDAGFRPGLWLAPFVVSRASRVAEAHPDWLLRDPAGRPVVALVNPAWRGSVCHALDPTHPGVCAWLAEVGRTLRGYGYDYLKLDFLYAGALPGRRHEPDTPSAEAYRRGVAALRAGAGDAFLLGCGAPLGPSVGLFEAMRIGPDVAPRWAPRRGRRLGIPAAPAAAHSVTNALTRAPLHRRLWINDPDCALLRDRDTELAEPEVRTVAGAIAVSGGQMVVSDDLAKLGPDRVRLLERLVPPHEGTAEPLPPDGEQPGGLLARLDDGSLLVLRVNLGPRPRPLSIDARALGMPGRVHVYDVWGDAHRGVQSGAIRLGRVPAHGCALLRLTPVGDEPRVVGSSLHLSAGALETRSIRADRGGAIELAIELPGRRAGRVHLAGAGGELRTLEVGFRDRLALELGDAGESVEPALGVEDGEPIEDG